MACGCGGARAGGATTGTGLFTVTINGQVRSFLTESEAKAAAESVGLSAAAVTRS